MRFLVIGVIVFRLYLPIREKGNASCSTDIPIFHKEKTYCRAEVGTIKTSTVEIIEFLKTCSLN